MAVLTVSEKAGGRTGGLKPFGERTAEIIFTVVCSYPQEETATVIHASAGGVAIPRIGSVWPYDGGLICDGIYPKQDDEQPRVWEVRCTFSANIIGVDVVGRQLDQQQSPLSAPPSIHFGAVKYQVQYDKDLDDSEWANTAGDPLIPAPMVDESRQTITITRNEATFNPAVAREWADVINSDTWWGYEPRMVKLSCPTARAVYSQQLWYWEVTYEFEVAGKLARVESNFSGTYWYPGWQPTVRNCGYRYKDANGKWATPTNDEGGDGVQFGGPVNLDGTGKKLAFGQPVWYIHGRSYEAKPFAQLNLP